MSLLFCSANSIARFSVSCTAPALALAAGACDASCANAGTPAVISAPTHKTSRQTFILNLLAVVLTMRASLNSGWAGCLEFFRGPPLLRRDLQDTHTAATQSAAAAPPGSPANTRKKALSNTKPQTQSSR